MFACKVKFRYYRQCCHHAVLQKANCASFGGAMIEKQMEYTDLIDAQYLIALCDSTLVDLQIVHVKSGQQHQLAEQQIQTIKQLRQQILRNQGATPETLSALNATASSLAHCYKRGEAIACRTLAIARWPSGS